MHYAWDARPNTVISASGQQNIKEILESEYAVFVGRNNCGKSFLLKTLTEQLGQNASYLGPGRYHNFNVLGHYTPNRNRKSERWRRLMQTRFDDINYRKRAQVETVMSMIKRRQGSYCRGRTYWSRRRELHLMALTHNIMILWHSDVFYRASLTPFLFSLWRALKRPRAGQQFTNTNSGYR